MIYGDYVWPFMACFNASGHPALNIPLGLGKEGRSEPEMIAFAKHVAQLTEGFVKPTGY